MSDYKQLTIFTHLGTFVTYLETHYVTIFTHLGTFVTHLETSHSYNPLKILANSEELSKMLKTMEELSQKRAI
jgi:hypothetical protein